MSVNNPSGNVSDRCMKIFEVFNQKVQPDDGLPRAVCDTWNKWNHGTNIMACKWEETDSKKKNGMPLSGQQFKRLSSFQTPSVTVQKHLSFPQCSRVFVQTLIR